MMRRVLIVPLIMCAGVVGCAKDDPGPPADDLIGSWSAVAIEFVGKAGQGSVNAFTLGWTAGLMLASDHTGALLMTRNDGSSWNWTGDWEVDGDLLRIAGQGADVSLGGGDLTLTGFDSAYDFDVDGAEDPAELNLVFRK